jgi:hypothetical protein
MGLAVLVAPQPEPFSESAEFVGLCMKAVQIAVQFGLFKWSNRLAKK